MSHWIYGNKKLTEIPDGAFGFVYRITNLKTDERYIGKKFFHTKRRIKRKNKKNRKVVIKESNWKSYTGSNDQLNGDIERHGKENFKFEILAIGYTKGQVNYCEELVQYKTNALIDPKYLNNSIGSRRYLNMQITERFRDSIDNMEL